MRKLLVFIVIFVGLIVFMGGCALVGCTLSSNVINRIPGLNENIIDLIPGLNMGEDEVTDDVYRTLRVEHDEHIYKIYESELTYAEASDAFVAYLTSEGYTESDNELITEFFATSGDAEYGGTNYESDDYYKYVFLTGSDGDVVIYTYLADKAVVEDFEDNDTDNDHDNDDNGNDEPDTHLPDEDVDGTDSSLIERYPESVRIENVHAIIDGDEKLSNTYLTDASVETVYHYYKDLISQDGFDIRVDLYVPSENAMHLQGYYYENGDRTHGFDIVAEEDNGLTELTIYVTNYGN